MSKREAWENHSAVMVTGQVTGVRVSDSSGASSAARRTAYYDFLVAEWLKPREPNLPTRLTIAESWGATDTADLRPGVDVLLFLVGTPGRDYRSVQETYLDSPEGQQSLRGVRLFLRVMNLDGTEQRQRACLEAWNDDLSEAEKRSVLDAMWLTRHAGYAQALLRIATGTHSPHTRGWALSILASIDNGQGVEGLVPLLSRETDCEIRRQLLLVFGTYRTREALDAIDDLLSGSQAGQCESWRVEDLRSYARQARHKITGTDRSPYWKD